jgi:hypothetical protein
MGPPCAGQYGEILLLLSALVKLLPVYLSDKLRAERAHPSAGNTCRITGLPDICHIGKGFNSL